MKSLFSIFLFIPLIAFGKDEVPTNEITKVKNQIIQLAQKYSGQPDKDFSKQRSLEVPVKRLLQLKPMAPIKDRIPILAGTWKQVWGPYDYRTESRGIDPELEVKEIYQVVFKEGYYYNVSPLYKDGDRNQERIGLLRGEFKLNPEKTDTLNVRFTKYPGVEPRPKNINIWELAPRAENGTLENEITIVPTWVVEKFYRQGQLREVYTDEDLRICYGLSDRPGSKPALYIMSRVK